VDSSGAAPRRCGDGGTGDQKSETVAQRRSVCSGYPLRPRLQLLLPCCADGGGGGDEEDEGEEKKKERAPRR
jgi:hypothetical protein